MMANLRRMMGGFRGAGDAALTVPPLDGAFRPNSAIETAPLVATCDQPDNLAQAGNDLFATSRGQLVRLRDGHAETVADGGARITALAGTGDGLLAVARTGGSLDLLEAATLQPAGAVIDGFGGDITAMAFIDPGHLVATVGAAGRASTDWRRDLMEHGRSGSLWLVDLAAPSKQRIAGDFAYPSGVAVTPAGDFLVALAWEHAVVRIERAGRRSTALANLPAYPWRLAPASDGYWLALAAPRNQLVELTLRETRFRREMLREMRPEHWIAPQLTRACSPLEVMQAGAERIGGQMKPWAPSLSYGLVARLDHDCMPQDTFHSRADGTRHGITSLIEQDGRLVATSQGANAVIGLEL